MPTKTTSRLVAGGFLLSALLAGCVSKNKYETTVAENQRLQAQNRADQEALAAEGAQISRLQGAVKITLESDLLFAPGSWEMSEKGKETIAKVAQRLAPEQKSKLVVVGYTDNQPIGPGLEQQGVDSNQELSQLRAEAVRDFLISQGVKPDMIEAVGKASSNPVASNDTAQGRAKNRRVELTFGG
ncbi:MAG: OmpA family protein [Kofleriaceae bacterium]|nr:OmpA family protein [Kofleriaceae bacterium]